MFALPIFPEERPERVAAVDEGRWRSVAEDIRRAPQHSPPSIVGVCVLNFCVWDGREPERCRWQSKRGRSVCRGSAENKPALSGAVFAGHRKRKQVDTFTVPIFLYKKPPHFCGGLVFALLIFPGSRPPSIVSVRVLNFCVRDGNRWTHTTINTNSISVAFTTFIFKANRL